MQRSTYALVGLLLGTLVQSARAVDFIRDSAAATGAAAQLSLPKTVTPSGYKLLRYDEDYRYLKDPASRSDFWDPIKYIPIGQSDWFLSFGGEVRERFENYSAANFGVPGKEADGYLLQRVLVH